MFATMTTDATVLVLDKHNDSSLDEDWLCSICTGSCPEARHSSTQPDGSLFCHTLSSCVMQTYGLLHASQLASNSTNTCLRLNLCKSVLFMQLLKTDARNWTSKYARGGNVRKPSARKMYIVVDALQGHITTNGYVDVAALVFSLRVVLPRRMHDSFVCFLLSKVGWGLFLLICSATWVMSALMSSAR